MEHTEKSWFALLEASTWEFPLAVQKWMLGGKDAALKTFHAWVNIANASVDRFYQTKGFCELMTGSLSWLLQWQRLGRSIAGTMMPGANMDMQNGAKADEPAVYEIVQRLSREVRQLTARLNMQEGPNGFRIGRKLEGDNDSASR